MNIGISTGCMYPELTEKCIDTFVSMGFDRFEVFVNTFSELEGDYLDKLKYHLDKYGAVVRSLHPFVSSFESFLLFSNYERRFLDGLDFYEMFFRSAKRLGADFVILHGLNTNYRSTLTNNEYFRRFSALQERAAQYGITLLQENVACFKSSSCSFLREMRDAIPEHTAFVCDIKQAYRSGNTPLDVIDAMGSKLRHIHISDYSHEGCCTLPGKGRTDFRQLICHLKDIGYDGDLILEVYSSDYNKLCELCQTRCFLQTLF